MGKKLEGPYAILTTLMKVGLNIVTPMLVSRKMSIMSINFVTITTLKVPIDRFKLDLMDAFCSIINH